MIYITGACHQDFRRFSTRIFPEQKEMTKEDYVIICGDFGGVWSKGKESREEKHLMDWLEGKSFTTLFVDGNHENFDRLYGYPVEEWHGGRVHKIRPSVIHMMRGQVFEIDGRRIFTFGAMTLTGAFWSRRILTFRSRRKNWIRESFPTASIM